MTRPGPVKAVLTGHTHGLGAALGAELMGRGITVLGLARGASAELASAFPALLAQVQIDLGDSAALQRWLASGMLEEFATGAETLLLVNNAGVVQPVGPLAQQDPAAVAQAVALNVSAPLVLAAALARQRKALRIVHVSSGAARQAYPGWSVYCATKAALDHHARAVAADGDRDVRICSLAPGVIDTGMQAAIRSTSEALFPGRARFVTMHEAGELSAPGDTAAKIVDYLSAPEFGLKPVDDLRAAAATVPHQG